MPLTATATEPRNTNGESGLKQAQKKIPYFLLALSKARVTSLSRDDLINLSREICKETQTKIDAFQGEIPLEQWIYLSCLRSHTRFLDRKIRNECLHLLMKKPQTSSSTSSKSKWLLERLHELEESMRLFCSCDELSHEDRMLLQRRYHLGTSFDTLASETNSTQQDLDKRLDTISQKLSLYWPDEVSPWNHFGENGEGPGSGDNGSGNNGGNGTGSAMQATERAPLFRIGEVLENEGKLWKEVCKALDKNHLESSKINAALQEMFGVAAAGDTKTSSRGQRSMTAAVLMAVAIFLSTIFQASSDKQENPGSTEKPNVIQASSQFPGDTNQDADSSKNDGGLTDTVPAPDPVDKPKDPSDPTH